MSNKKNRRRSTAGASAESKSLPLRTLLLLLLSLVLTAAAYYAANRLWAYSFLVFYGLAFVLGFAYIAANRFFSRNGVTPSDLPDSMSPVEKQKWLDEREERKAETKWIMYFLLPLLLVIGFDILYLFFGETVSNLFPFLK